MSTDAKKHTNIAAGEKPTRQALADSILSINDLVPVASATEQAQVAQALGSGQPFPSKPLATMRADAPGLHRLEYTYDAGVTPVFLPASGVLHFANLTAANNWASSNSALLIAGDKAQVGTQELVWSGTAWFFTPGQVLASLVGPNSNTTGANALVGSVISTPLLAAGQKVKIVGALSLYNTSAAGPSEVYAKWRNNATDVTATTYDGAQGVRGYSSAASTVSASASIAAIVTATTAAKISAGIFVGTATSGVFGADGTHFWIEAA